MFLVEFAAEKEGGRGVGKMGEGGVKEFEDCNEIFFYGEMGLHNCKYKYRYTQQPAAVYCDHAGTVCVFPCMPNRN